MAAVLFLDTNMLVRLMAQDHETHSRIAGRILDRIERKELNVKLSDTVIFETAFVLQSFYKWSRSSIRDAILTVIQLPNVDLPTKTIYPEVFDLYTTRRTLSFADAFHAALSKSLNCDGLVSFDIDFDKIPGVVRIPPEHLI